MYNSKKVIPTTQQIKMLESMGAEGASIRQMAAALGRDRSVVKRIIAEYNIYVAPHQKDDDMKKRSYWGETKINKLKQFYTSELYSIDDICSYFKMSKLCITNKAADLNLVKTPYKEYSKEELDYIKEHSSSNSLKAISEYLGRPQWSVAQKLADIGVGSLIHRIRIRPNTIEFDEDLGNPALSHAVVARKYNVGVSTIVKWRKETFGSWKRLVDTYLCKSTAEIDFEDKILVPLKLCYQYEYKVQKWKLDYYLGFNVLIEVQGEYWHSLEKVKDKDQRKKEELEKLGYSIIYIAEEDLKNETKIEQIKINILNVLHKNIKKYYGSLNLVNLEN